MGIQAEECGLDICKAIALLSKWKDYALISQSTLDYLQRIAAESIGKDGVKNELTKQGVKVK